MARSGPHASIEHLDAPDVALRCSLGELLGTLPRPPPMNESPINAHRVRPRAWGITPHACGRVFRVPCRRHGVEREERAEH